MKISRLAKTLIISPALVFYSGQGWSDTWQQDVSARMLTEYVTNPVMLPTYSPGVWGALFQPSYTLLGNIGANELKTGAALDIERYSNNTVIGNRQDPSAFLDWSRKSDTDKYGISSKYLKTSTLIAETNIAGPGFADSTLISRTISGNWDKALSERSTLSADSAYEGDSFNGGNYVDYSTESGSLKFNYALSETTTSSLQASEQKYIPSGGGPPSSLVFTMLGLDWKVEYMNISIQVGDYNSGGHTGILGATTMQYSGQRTQLALNANRQSSPSALGGFDISSQVGGNWSYSLSDVSKTGIDLVWQKNHFLVVNTADIVNNTAGAWVQNELNAFWSLRTEYQRRLSEQVGVGVGTSTMLGVTLIYTHTGF